MVVLIDHIHHIVTVNADTARTFQFCFTVSFLSKLPQIPSICCKHLNAVVVSISDIHNSSAVTCNVTWVVELSIANAVAAKAARECEVSVQNLNTIIVFCLQCIFSCCLG